jgi:hypothetical protein
MNVEPTQQPTTDDPELAKVLEANDEDQSQTAVDDVAQSGLQFEETPVAGDSTLASVDDQALSSADDAGLDSAINQLTQATPEEATSQPVVEEAAPAPVAAAVSAAPAGGLDDIKKDALGELRPLVDKLSLPADEKFDIMLLIIRSTDDQSLVAAAHEAAKQIEDETKRAQALLDVVKEIDYFSGQGQQAA